MKYAFTLGMRSEGIYKFIGRPLLALVHNTNHLTELWHCRLAHIHYDSLPKFKILVLGILDVQAQHDGFFHGFTSGKKTRGPFPSSKNKKTKILHLIISDICGMMHVHSVGGNIYYITSIDDFSGKAWLYCLKHKE